MRDNALMTTRTLFLATVTSALLLTGALAGCGGDDDSSSPSTGTAASSNPGTGSGSGKKDDDGQSTGNGPASASDESKDAPDDAISDRPGGPNSGPPVDPVPPK